MTLRSALLTGVLASITLAPVAIAAPVRDGDGDGMPTSWEKKHHLNPRVDDSGRDKDRDGLDNLGEYEAKTNPRKKDTDRDGVRDSDEDCDRDGLSNSVERRHGLHPGRRDSDRDGIGDRHTPAGTIVSFDGTTLVITKLDGTELRGTVTARTEIECEVHGSTGHRSKHGADDPVGDDSRPAGTTPVGTTPSSDDSPSDDSPETEDDSVRCGTEALVPGAEVRKARLEGTWLKKVHLN